MQSQLYPLNQRGDVTQVKIVVIVLRLDLDSRWSFPSNSTSLSSSKSTFSSSIDQQKSLDLSLSSSGDGFVRLKKGWFQKIISPQLLIENNSKKLWTENETRRCPEEEELFCVAV